MVSLGSPTLEFKNLDSQKVLTHVWTCVDMCAAHTHIRITDEHVGHTSTEAQRQHTHVHEDFSEWSLTLRSGKGVRRKGRLSQSASMYLCRMTVWQAPCYRMTNSMDKLVVVQPSWTRGCCILSWSRWE